MFRCSLPLFALIAAVALFAVQSTLAEDKTHDGMVVSAGAGKLTMTMTGDTKRHTHDVAKDARITIDGKAAKLEELKEHFHVKVTTDDKNVVKVVEAHSKAK